VLGSLALIGLVLAVLVAGGIGMAGSEMLSSCSLAKLRPIGLGENSFLYASDGSLLGAIPSATNRSPLQLGAMSQWLPKATVAIEDRRFYEHGGVDYVAIVRAAVADLKAGRIVQGGSTITQELVRNLYLRHPQRTLQRKIEEACLANKLAQRWSKDRILAAYLNEAFYGHHAYGVQAAAQTYFSRRASELTLPQAALIAGIPQSPAAYDPLLHPTTARLRRNEVLTAMLNAETITPAEWKWAEGTPLRIRPGRLYLDVQHPDFFGYAEQQLVQRYGVRLVEGGGLHVETTLDPRLQQAARAAIAVGLPHRFDPAAALVAVDPRTGAVRAMTNYLPDRRPLQFNLASQGQRQAGSAFKPFVLATALDEGVSLYTDFYGAPSMTITDPRCATNGVPWEVHNYADESAGTMNLVDATAHSVNTIFAQLVDKVGPANVVPVAHRMGITSPLAPVCSITLGTQAVSPLEMTDAYATFAARGVHHAPQALARVTGPHGSVLGQLDARGTRAIPQSTADLVTYVLQHVVQYGTGTAAALSDRPVAGKTGTAENYVDAWFCGYVPQLATCVWVGYPSHEQPLVNVEGLAAVFGGSIPAEIWHDFMTTALAATTPLQFVAPESFSPTTASTTATTTSQ
jgi:penicillin-binding protein 1A